MNRSQATRWGVGALAVTAIAVGGVFANLAVLDNSEADASIGTLSAKGITQTDDGRPLPPIVLPTPPPDDHHDDGEEHDHDTDDD